MSVNGFRSGALAGAFTIVAAAAFAQGAGGQAGRPPVATDGTTTGAARSENQQSDSRSRKYVEHMLIANMAEIQLGQLGAERATSSDVKSFAQQMVTDHTRANAELMPIAQQLGAERPAQLDAKHQKIADKLSTLRGGDFDRQFMKAMIAAHKEVVSETKKIVGDRQGDQSTRSAGGDAATGTVAATGTSASPTTPPTAVGTSGTSGSGTAAAGSSTRQSATGTDASTGAAAMGGAQSVAQYAAMTLPIVQQHLQHAETIEQTAGKSNNR